MTVDNDREYFDDPAEGGESADDWFFDLPQGAWERQEAKRRQLRDRLLSQAGEVEPPPPRKNPLDKAAKEPEPKHEEKRSRWGLFRRHHDDQALEETAPAFRAEDFVMGAEPESPPARPTFEAAPETDARGAGWDDQPATAQQHDERPVSLWDAALQQTEDPLEAMRRWATGHRDDTAQETASLEDADAPPGAQHRDPVWAEPLTAAHNEAADAAQRWSRAGIHHIEDADEPPLAELDPIAPESIISEAEDDFEPWAKELLEADEEPPPHSKEKRGILGKLFGRGDEHEPDIDEVIAHAETEGSWTPASDEPSPAREAAPDEATLSFEKPPEPEAAVGLSSDPWAEFLRARAREQDPEARPTGAEEPDSPPFAKGSSIGESADAAASIPRVEEPAPAVEANRGGWRTWDADSEDVPCDPADATERVALEPLAALGEDKPHGDEDTEDETPRAESEAPASAWDGWSSLDESTASEPSREWDEPADEPEPATSVSAWDNWDAGAGSPDEAGSAATIGPADEPEPAPRAYAWDNWDASSEAAREPVTTPASDDESARDDVWDAIAAEQTEDEVGVFLRAPGVLGGRRLHRQPAANDDDAGFPTDDELADQPAGEPEPDEPAARTERGEQAWVLEGDEEDIIVRAFEEHAATAIDEDDASLSPEHDTSLQELLGEDVTPDTSIDDDPWTPHRVVEAEDEIVANFMGDDGGDDVDAWHEDGPPWNRDTATRGDEPARPRGSRSKTLVRELVETGLLALLVFLAVRASFQNFRVEGESMYPTLEDGQYVIVNKLVYSEVDMDRLSDFVPIIKAEEGEKRHVFHGAQRGDIVVFHSPRDPSEDLIKRVIAVPGETIEILDGKVYVNDRLLEEPYITTPWHGNHPKILIPEDQYFVMGDNRNNSQDSRSPQVGLVHADMIVGKVALSYWPAGKFGFGPGGGAVLTDELRPAAVAAAPPGE